MKQMRQKNIFYCHGYKQNYDLHSYYKLDLPMFFSTGYGLSSVRKTATIQ